MYPPGDHGEVCQFMLPCPCGRFKPKLKIPWQNFGKEDFRGCKWGLPDVVYQRWETVTLFVGVHGLVGNGGKRLGPVRSGAERWETVATVGNGRKR